MYLPIRLKNIYLIIFILTCQNSFSQTTQDFSKLYENTANLIDQDNYKKAFDQVLTLETIGSDNNDNTQLSQADYLLAKIYKKQENYLQTIKYATKSIDAAKKEGNIEYEIKSSELLAWGYVYIGFLDEAKEILKNIDHLLANYNGKHKHYFIYKKLYREASLMKRKEEKPKQILQVYFQALKEINQYPFKKEYQKNENFLSLYNNIGVIYKDINVDSSFVYFQKAYQFRDNFDERGKANLDTNIASYYVSKNKNQEAIDLLSKSIPALIKSDHKFLTSESYKVLSDAYKNENNQTKSLEYNTLYLTYKDSLNLKRNQSVNEAVEYVKKLNKENHDNKENTTYIYIGLGLILLIVLVLIFKNNKRKS